ncbi:MAG TPA: hypothetical protein VFR14_01010 [Candidatus Limnocylindrales bacterium]|nr:hypothetical protein [Candidatus Limnocylindrales bacterium]
MIHLPRFRSSIIGIVAALSGGTALVLPAPALACQVAGWTMSEVASRAVVILEGVVAAELPGGGYELSVRHVHKGSGVGDQLTIGTRSSTSPSDCMGWVGLDAGDHILIALADPETALATETAVWWIEPDGSVEQRSLVNNPGPTTLRAVIAALRAELPDTATEPAAHAERGGDRASTRPVLFATLLLGVGAWLSAVATRRRRS